MENIYDIKEYQRVYQKLITESFDIDIGQKISAGNYEVRPWSYIMTIKKNNVLYYAKVPKEAAESSDILSDILSKKNRNIAFNEIADLTFLNNIFIYKSNLQVVNLVGYSSKFNAVITRAYEGLTLHSISRTKKCKYITEYYASIGNWLSIYHKHKKVIDSDVEYFLKIEETDIKRLFEWLSLYCSDLYLKFNSKSFISKFLENEKRLNYCAYTLRGFETRNFLVGSTADSICFLDPTEILVGSQLDDVARFIVSIDMISWGYLDAYISKDYEECKEVFLESYFGNKYKESKELLYFYVIKWLLIRWKEASNRVNRLKVNNNIKNLIKIYYSDYLFIRWINTYLETI